MFISVLPTGGSSSLVSSRALSGSMVAPLNVEDADEDLPPGSMTGAGEPCLIIVDKLGGP